MTPQTTEPRMQTTWLSLLAGSLLCVLVLLLWWMLNSKKNEDLLTKIEVEAGKLADYIDADQRNRLPALQRLARRWEYRKGVPKDEFDRDALAYVYDLPGFQAIEWVDETYHGRWIVPLKGNERALNLNLAFEQNRRFALEKAKAQKTPTMTAPIELVQGGKGFHIYFPIFIEGRFGGFILAVFRTEEWLTYVFDVKNNQEEKQNFKISVFMDKTPVFRENDWADQNKVFEASATTEIMGHLFTVKLRPTDHFFKQNRTVINEVIVTGGFLLSVLVAFMIYLSQKATEQSWRIHAAKVSLENAVKELNETKDELQFANTRLTLATKAGKIGVWTWDIHTGKLTWNDVMHELYDVPHDVSPVYETWKNSLHPDDSEHAENLIKLAVEGKAVFEMEFRIVLHEGFIRHIRTAAKVDRDKDGKPLRMTGINMDITDQKEAEETILHLATHDALTSLPTLMLAKDRILMAIENARRNKINAAILFIDLDGFKHVNDTHGHDIGDALLKEVAQRLVACVRKSDTVARIGGDEFIMILTDVQSHENVSKIAENALNLISRPFDFKGIVGKVGASIGISLYPENGEDIESLIKQADTAMYTVKNAEKNGFAFAERT